MSNPTPDLVDHLSRVLAYGLGLSSVKPEPLPEQVTVPASIPVPVPVYQHLDATLSIQLRRLPGAEPLSPEQVAIAGQDPDLVADLEQLVQDTLSGYGIDAVASVQMSLSLREQA